MKTHNKHPTAYIAKTDPVEGAIGVYQSMATSLGLEPSAAKPLAIHDTGSGLLVMTQSRQFYLVR